MSDRLFARLDELERDFEQLTTALADPEGRADRPRAAGAAVLSAIMAAADPAAVTRSLLAAFDR